MTKSREEMDELCWASLHARVPHPGPPPTYAERGVVSNFEDLAAVAAKTGDFETAFHAFVHTFYFYKVASFFALPPPESLPIERRAQCAGAAESLCVRFGLPVPAWTEEPDYFLPEPWDPAYEWRCILPVENIITECSPAFLRRNVLWADRDLIAI